MALHIAAFREADWPDIWAIIEPVFREGESYPCARDISEDEAKAYWLAASDHVFVARAPGGALVGTYYIRKDQGGPGDHICNCGYVVRPSARGKGIGVALCRDSQERARALGFLGMKFNLVVSTNAPAVKAWRRAGLEIIGVTPRAFRSRRHGLVNAYIMYMDLTAAS